MKTPRVVMTSCVLAVFLLAFFFAPVPVTRVREIGLVTFQPHDMVPHYVETAGILKKLHVQEGQYVTKGKVLAEFTNLELENAQRKAEHNMQLQRKLFEHYDIALQREPDPNEKRRIHDAWATARGELIAAQRELATLNDHVKRLTLVAKRSGHVLGVPQQDEIGRMWEQDYGVPFCSIGDRTKLRIIVPVTTSDFELIHTNLKRRGPEPLLVTIRMQGRGSKTWQGRVNPDLPKSEAREIPLPLSSKGGGPLAVKPSSDPNQLVPQSQVFLINVDFEEADTAVCTGTMAQVKIHNDYRSTAWWCWRSISQAIDLYLL